MLTAVALSVLLGTETLVPFQETVLIGTQNSGGNLASWTADDSDLRTLCRFLYPDPRILSRVILRFRLGKVQQPKTMEMRVKVGGHTPGPQNLSLFMINPANNNAEQGSVFDVRIVDGTTYVGTMPHPPNRYISADGVLSLRVEVWRRGPSTRFDPCTSFEFANLVLGD